MEQDKSNVNNQNYLTILLVEDDLVDQLAFTRLVKESNLPYQSSLASSFSEAQSILNSKLFDFVILDLNLGDGIALYLVKTLEQQNTPFLITTASGNEEIAVKAMKMGASDYLIKDIDRHYFNMLPITIEKAIETKKTESKNRLLTHAIDSITDYIYMADEQGCLLFVNNSMSNLCSFYNQEELIGKPLEILGQEDLSRVFKEDNSCVELSKFRQVEILLKKSDGSFFPALLLEYCIEEEGKNFRFGVIRDIS